MALYLFKHRGNYIFSFTFILPQAHKLQMWL
jgi:hypothetical protein